MKYQKKQMIRAVEKLLIRKYPHQAILTGSHFLKHQGVLSREIGDLDILVANTDVCDKLRNDLVATITDLEKNTEVTDSYNTNADIVKNELLKIEIYTDEKSFQTYFSSTTRELVQSIMDKKIFYITSLYLNDVEKYSKQIKKHLKDLKQIQKFLFKEVNIVE